MAICKLIMHSRKLERSGVEVKANAKLPVHGASVLPSVSVESYNLEIKDNGGFVGDKASKSAFARILKKWVDLAGEAGREPLGNIDLANPDKDKLAALLADGDPDAASLVMSALAEYSHELAAVLKRYLRLKEWKKVSSVVVGGGFMANRLGQMAIAHTEWLLRAEGIKLNLLPIRNDPDEAALLGGVHLLPPWMFASHKAMLAVENTRGGIGKAAMKLNDATPKIEVDPETYEVRADGELLTCEPATELPMAQRYFLF